MRACSNNCLAGGAEELAMKVIVHKLCVALVNVLEVKFFGVQYLICLNHLNQLHLFLE